MIIINYVMLNIDIKGEGTVSLAPPSGVYDFGVEVTLFVNPGRYEVFEQWGGDLSGSINPVFLLMDGNKEVITYMVSLRPFVTGIATTVNNEDGFTVASSSKPGYIYIVKYGNKPQTKSELDSLVIINEGISYEAPMPDVSVAIYTKGLPGGIYEYYATDEEGRISFAGDNILVIHETGPTGINNNYSEKPISVSIIQGQFVVDPGNDNNYSLQIFTTTGEMLYSEDDLNGIQNFNTERYTGAVIIRKLSGQEVETVKLSILN
jgi:hypothetical protein